MEESVNPLRFETNPYHHVVIKDRKTMELSGVKQIDSFDSDEFLLETTLGLDADQRKRSIFRKIRYRARGSDHKGKY